MTGDEERGGREGSLKRGERSRKIKYLPFIGSTACSGSWMADMPAFFELVSL